jgi:uncharacterized RDD family membrane protein YckC
MSSWEPPQNPSDPNPSGQSPSEQPPQGPPPFPASPPQGQPQYGQPSYPQQPPPPPQYGQQAFGGYAAAPPPPPGMPGAAGVPGATGPLNIGNRVVAFIIDWAIFIILDVIALASGSAGFRLVIDLLVIAVAIYFIYLDGSVGQTPGKKIMGVKIVDANTGQVIGFGRAFLRLLVQGLCNIVCLAGLWSAFLDSGSGRYQGWHDKAIGTQVISVK